MRPSLLLILWSPVLTGCATAHRVVDTPPKAVPIPVPVTCVPALPAPLPYPDTPEALHAASDILTRAKLVMAGRLMRIQRELELNIALAACSTRVSK